MHFDMYFAMNNIDFDHINKIQKLTSDVHAIFVKRPAILGSPAALLQVLLHATKFIPIANKLINL